jgi:hypothetical protein
MKPTQIYASAWRQLLGERQWDHFATLTSKRPASVHKFQQEFERFVRGLSLICQGPVPYAAAVESAGNGLSIHLHCLLGGSAKVRVESIRRLWRLGHSQVSRFQPNRRTVEYMGKGGFDDPETFFWSKRLPPENTAVVHLGRRIKHS